MREACGITTEEIRLAEDWRVIEQLLPEHWEQQGRVLGAFRRGRQIPDVTTLLRVLLIHLAQGCGQRETAARGELRFLASTGAMHHRINTPVVNSALDYRSG